MSGGALFTILLTLVERWDGHRWAVQRSANPKANAGSAQLGAVWCGSASSCVAVGQYQQAVSFLHLPFAAAWNGKTWQVQAMPGGRGANVISGVSCGAIGVCTAVGTTTANAAQINATLVEVRG